MEDPTPCRVPRHSLGPARRRQSIRPPSASKHHSSDQTSTRALIDDYTIENNTICLDFAKVKPRRPRTSRQSFIWDPSADIYEDTTCQPTEHGITLDQHGDRTLSIAPLARDRRSSLLAQPAQRPVKDASNLAAISELKRSRSSLAHQPIPTQSHRTSMSSHNAQTSSTVEKDLRRRTIWVPSDDTTIMTIHPGASLNDHRAPSKKIRRSDVFLDLAEVVEEEEETNKNDVTMHSPHTDGISRPARRSSLAVAPRRAPLRQTMRPLQTLSTIVDVPGNSTGKENVPPDSVSHTASKHGRRPSIAVKLLAASEETSGFKKSSVSDGDLSRKPQPFPAKSNTPVESYFLRSSTQKDQTCTATSRPLQSSQRNRYSSTDSTSLFARAAITVNKRMSANFAGAPPTRLSVPVVSFNKSHNEMFPVLHEDITKPDMYEDNWLGQQETAISQVLNCLFEKAGNHTGLTRSLGSDARAALLTVYNDTSFSLLYKRLKASLLYGALSIPKDVVNQSIRIKDDLAQRRRFLDLWMKTYDLSHLQAAAEVVVGRQIPQSQRNSESGSPNRSTAGFSHASPRAIEAFLKTYLVFNEDKTPSGRRETTMDGSLSAAYHVRDWQHTVLRSLMLVILLDQAKDKARTPGLLFQVTSPNKSSAAVLQCLSKLLLPSVGDVIRVLSHLDYHVSSAQYPLQEREYTINNLAVDLRDGVLLTRLVELLLYPPTTLALQGQDVTVTLPCGDILTRKDDGTTSAGWVLSQHLKYPCIGRTQKVYNAQIALSALQGVKGLEGILDNFKAEHIVDGHREKTLGLLWSLVGRWGLEMLLDADMLQHEVTRLQAARERDNVTFDDTDFELETRCLQGMDKYNYLLKTWAKEVALRRGRTVSNLSTAFADGSVFEAIVELYRPSISSANTTHGQESIGSTLKSLGCSQAFISLFRKGSISVPSPQTVIPQLAFLAARLLPAARPYHAALTIQRAWRRKEAWKTLRKGLALARLAHACAIVVQTRERIIWATMTLQRRWKAVLMTRPRHERPV